ncbi:helix-turn-helix transcriptional regulator [Paenibacillus tarimensis]|uniref:helix-turn-helix transcriptional regulator n=1 Tax=Paenibacillus tarimensis TaxID=416012 RepID=UPI001F22698E|nr:ArsR family transcriptional regulator [Paenibacillus tarimensis]MCF2943188.1 ArsR family transcriptional regulator [Paenibacillus tarimensis]
MGTAGKDEQMTESGNRHDGTTRQMVLKLLKTKGPRSAGELSRHLGITEMAVRRHLSALESDGYIAPSLVKQPMGRPAYVYGLTEEAEQLFPRNYHTLALDLLEELEDGGDTIGRLFEARKLKLKQRYAGAMEGKSLRERVSELARIQNAGGYMVEVEPAEANPDTGFVMNEYNCPIAQVAGRYQQACSCELELFEALLEAKVERTECLAKGGSRCSYTIIPTE